MGNVVKTILGIRVLKNRYSVSFPNGDHASFRRSAHGLLRLSRLRDLSYHLATCLLGMPTPEEKGAAASEWDWPRRVAALVN